MSENDKLTRNQRRAIPALLSHRSISEAAESIGLADRTIYRYLEEKHFREALTEAERASIDEAGLRLLGGQDKALSVLEGIMDNPRADNSNRRLAAKGWLDLVLKWRELWNVEDRLEALEKAVYHETNN